MLAEARRIAIATPPIFWLLVGIAAAARFATLDLQSYWEDEVITAAFVIQPGAGETLSAVADHESNPPLYYVTAWLWSQPFGTGEVGLRSLSALFGTLTVPVAWMIGLHLGSRRTAAIAAALVAANPILVWYSQDARPYALLVLLSALSFLFFLRSRSDPTTGNYAGWAVASGLALATHYFAAFLIAAEAAVLLARGSRRRRPCRGRSSAAAAGDRAGIRIAQRLDRGHPARKAGW